MHRYKGKKYKCESNLIIPRLAPLGVTVYIYNMCASKRAWRVRISYLWHLIHYISILPYTHSRSELSVPSSRHTGNEGIVFKQNLFFFVFPALIWFNFHFNLTLCHLSLTYAQKGSFYEALCNKSPIFQDPIWLVYPDNVCRVRSSPNHSGYQATKYFQNVDVLGKTHNFFFLVVGPLRGCPPPDH